MKATAATLRPPSPGGMGRGALLATLVHIGLVIALALGVSWRSSAPTGATAELWAAVPEVAAPALVAPPPPPIPKPEPKAVETPPPPPKPETRDADIAIEKAKVEKERREREERERAEKEKLDKAKAEQAKAEKTRAEKAEAERLAKLREEQLARVMGQAGATGGPQSTGTAQRDAGPSSSYAGRIIARVKPNIVFTESVPPTLRAEVQVRAAPDGTITGRTLVKSSGNKDWDDAVLRAIDRTEVLPRDVDGRVPPLITIGFTPS